MAGPQNPKARHHFSGLPDGRALPAGAPVLQGSCQPPCLSRLRVPCMHACVQMQDHSDSGTLAAPKYNFETHARLITSYLGHAPCPQSTHLHQCVHAPTQLCTSSIAGLGVRNPKPKRVCGWSHARARAASSGAPPEFEEVQRTGWRQERRTRRLAQVFLRGDSVVLIARWPAGAS